MSHPEPSPSVTQFILVGPTAIFPLRPIQTAGRSSQCEITIPDLSVSREHARLIVEGERVRVQDLESRNGTYVNGLRITTAEMQLNGVVAFGRVRFQLALSETPSEPESMVSQLTTQRILRDGSPPTHRLSVAERRVLDVLLNGVSEQEAADNLNLSRYTVHNHVKSIYRKLKVSSRAALLSLILKGESTKESTEGSTTVPGASPEGTASPPSE